MKLLRNLLKSPMFVIGMSLFFGTLLFALLAPLFYNVTLDRVGEQYMSSGPGYILGTDHLGRDYVSLLIKGLRSSLYVGFVAGIIATTVEAPPTRRSFSRSVSSPISNNRITTPISASRCRTSFLGSTRPPTDMPGRDASPPHGAAPASGRKAGSPTLRRAKCPR